jgi:uncharacterized protein YrrD
MLRSLNSVIGSAILAKDGELGHVRDFLFDDRVWAVRYVVVETGSWLASRQVLLSPSVAGRPDWEQPSVAVDLTMEQVRSSPDVDTAKPVSRQEEIAMSQHYGWPAYWSMEPRVMFMPAPDPGGRPEGDPHLRSVKEVSGYEVHATDAEIGRVDSQIMDDATWFIRYLVVSTGNWFSGQSLLLSSRSVASISWSHRQVLLIQSREEM